VVVFARSIVHTLKNPLSNHSVSLAETLDRPDVRRKRAPRPSPIRKQVERISDMVGDILIFTEGKPMDAEIKPASYHTFVRDLIADSAPKRNSRCAHQMQNEPPAILISSIAPPQPRFLQPRPQRHRHDANGGTIFCAFTATKKIVTEIEDTAPASR